MGNITPINVRKEAIERQIWAGLTSDFASSRRKYYSSIPFS
jgi:hypothetical protein